MASVIVVRRARRSQTPGFEVPRTAHVAPRVKGRAACRTWGPGSDVRPLEMGQGHGTRPWDIGQGHGAKDMPQDTGHAIAHTTRPWASMTYGPWACPLSCSMSFVLWHILYPMALSYVLLPCPISCGRVLCHMVLSCGPVPCPILWPNGPLPEFHIRCALCVVAGSASGRLRWVAPGLGFCNRFCALTTIST